jgi:hypothetical protein
LPSWGCGGEVPALHLSRRHLHLPTTFDHARDREPRPTHPKAHHELPGVAALGAADGRQLTRHAERLRGERAIGAGTKVVSLPLSTPPVIMTTMPQPAPVRMVEVHNVEELRRNIAAFRDGWRSHPDLMTQLGLFRLGSYWVFDESLDAFANAKFAGYKGMTVNKYALARDGQFEGDFTGGVNKRIARVLRQPWRHDRELSARLSRFAVRLAGADAITGINESKWQFIAMPPGSTFVPKAARRVNKRVVPLESGDPELDTDLIGTEGGKKLTIHLRTERDAALVAAIKRRWSADDARLSCVVCGFSFLETYGELGRGFIEAHHRELLSSRGQRRTSTEEDFEPVCANCHRMLHRMGIDTMDTGRLMAIVKLSRDE